MTHNPEERDNALVRWNRRGFLGAGSLAAATFAAPWTVLADEETPAETEEKTSTYYEAFSQPPVVPSQKGVATLNMTVEKTEFSYQCGKYTKKTNSRTFNNGVPAPTILVDPGDKIKIRLDNHLEPNKKNNCPGTLDAPSCFNSTNLHFHGLHVSPSSYINDQGEYVLSSDDVLYQLDPQESHNWCVWLPDFHAPGTHWYHAHRHGSTALQVSNGMAGAIVIREPLEYRIVDPTQDKVFLIQEIVPSELFQNPDKAVYRRTGKRLPFGSAGDFLINGRCKPTLEMQAGKVQRWRFINGNATPRGLVTLKLCKAVGPNDTIARCSDRDVVDMYLMAVDGISFYGKPPEPIGPSNTRDPQWTGWQMAPGNRADFLVKLPAATDGVQWYKLIKDRHPGAGQSTDRQILAYIKVQPSQFDEKIPDIIPGSLSDYPYLTPIQEDQLANKKDGKICPRTITFSRTPPAGSRSYKINDQIYCPDCTNIEVKLGEAEQWVLQHKSGSAHPFHIHVNPFQIVGDKIDPNGPDEPDNWRWWDTIALLGKTPQMQPLGGGPVVTRNHFLDYNGTYVIHCHILIHEDQGMMINVTVNGDGIKPCYSLDKEGNSSRGAEIPDGAKVKPSPPPCPPEGNFCSGTNSATIDPVCSE
ncbi:MAG: multicopper oxidase family protein [Spirulina sp.]